MPRFSTPSIPALLIAVLLAFSGVALDAGASAPAASSTATHAKQKRLCKHKHRKGTKRHTHKTCTHRKRRHRPANATPPPANPQAGQALVGTFKLATGTYARGTGAGGSYFRMIFPGGSVSRGPYFENPSSASADKTYTLMTAGTDGGLIAGSYQEPPTPAFDGDGNALANRIIQPQRFAGRNFSISTSPKDPQTGLDVPAPSISVADGKLSGDLQAWAAGWNRLWFNQGSPKPGGGMPGRTTPVGGTYDESTHAYVLEWASSIVGGPFNGFTGYWHLQGVFEPRSTTSRPAPLIPPPPPLLWIR